MVYALIQHEFRVIELEVLAEALLATGVNQVDARVQAKQARPGIPGFGLSEGDSTIFQQALEQHGIETDAVALADLFPLPDQQTFNRGSFGPDGFTAVDMYDRPQTIPWRDIKTIAAGEVMESQIINTLSAPKSDVESAISTFGRAALNTASALSVATGGRGIFILKKSQSSIGVDTGSRSNQEMNYMLEIVGTGEYPRIRVRASKFDYSSLGDAMTAKTSTNFVTLLKQCYDLAPDSVYIDANINALVDDVGDNPLYGFSSSQKWDAYIFWLLQQG
jgi:hypothetical protein